jgi:hypothetical protein
MYDPDERLQPCDARATTQLSARLPASTPTRFDPQITFSRLPRIRDGGSCSLTKASTSGNVRSAFADRAGRRPPQFARQCKDHSRSNPIVGRDGD